MVHRQPQIDCPETRSHDRYVIDRVTAQSHSLTLRDAQGETQVVRISSLDSR